MNVHYSKREYEVAVLRSSDLENQSEHYRFGFELPETAYLHQYEDKFGTAVGGSIPWVDYLTGARDKEQLAAHKKMKEYKIAEFIQKFNALCKEYDADIIASDYYSSTIGSCKDIDFTLE